MQPQFRLLTDGQRAQLVTAYSVTARGRVWVVPAGFVTDWASVPRFLWPMIPPMGRWSVPALVHDYLYRTHIVPRAEADAVFLELMRRHGTNCFTRNIIFRAVRLFGGVAWRRHHGG